MKLRELPLVSLARSGVVTLPAAAAHEVIHLDVCVREGAGVALSEDVRDARRQGIGALFARLRGGTALAPTRQ